MGLLGNLVRASVRSVVRLVVWLIGVIVVHTLALIFLFVVRWVIPTVIWASGKLIVMEMAAMLSLVRGIPETVDIIEEDWIQEMGKRGLQTSPLMSAVARRIVRVFAYLSLVIGWVIMAITSAGIVIVLILIV